MVTNNCAPGPLTEPAVSLRVQVRFLRSGEQREDVEGADAK